MAHLHSLNNNEGNKPMALPGENPWEDIQPVPTSHKQGPTVVGYCGKPGRFWPDSQEPPFKGQKVSKHIFVTQGKFESRKEITRNCNEINRLKDEDRLLELFHPRMGDIHLYHNYSDYDSSDEEDLFDLDKDDVIPHPAIPPPITVAPAPPPITIHVPVGKWINRGDKPVDPEDLHLLSEIMYIPQEVYNMLLLSSDHVTIWQILKFRLPNIDIGVFTETRTLCFDRARPNKNLELHPVIPPKSWVYSLRQSLNNAIQDGQQSILHPRFKDQPLPLWMLTLWEKLHAVHEAKMTWLDADMWLQKNINRLWSTDQSDASFC
ncbi:hypothetical protein EDB19DRAFT_1906800 [Suillus lakei]|nr:hypothetical protein EDB19DRAFT_1906800 [Suillus lakei]